MAYATSEDVLRRYTPLNTMLGIGTLDISTIDIASIYIADGESIVNGYLAARYVMPLAVEPLVTDITSDIAIYRVLRDKTPRIPDFMQTRYNDAIALLTQLRDGGMLLSLSVQQVNSGGDQEAWSNVLDADFNGTVFKPAEASSLCYFDNSSPSYLDFG